MKTQVYDEWIKMYDDNLADIWNEERIELKNASILLFVLKKELSRIQTEVEQEVVKTRRSLEKRDELDDSYTSSQSDIQEIKKNKENVGPLWATTCVGIQHLHNLEDLESPEIFKVASPEFSKADFDKKLSENETSPTINKRKLRPQKKFKQNRSPSLLLSMLSEDNCQSPVASTCRTNEFKTPEANQRQLEKPGSDCYVLDNTIIESTPNIPSVKKSKSLQILKSHRKCSSLRLKMSTKKTKSDDVTNVLQGASAKESRKIEPEKAKGSLAYLDEDDFPSSMEINDILKFVEEVNISNTSKSSASSNDDNPSGDNKPTMAGKKYLISQDCMRNSGKNLSNGDNQSGDNRAIAAGNKYQISQDFIKNYDNFNKTVQNPEQPFKEVIRGKERKQLDGWACQECKEFYEGMNLPPEELKKKMNHCSKHRSKFNYLQKTYSAFWGMDMPSTPDSQPTQEQSIVFHP